MQAEIIIGLMQRGIPMHVAQGITANMKAESRLDPGINEENPIVEGSRGGFGLNQWTGPRRRQFEEFARSRGSALDDLDTQLDFTMWELQNTEKRAWDKLQGASNAEEAAMIYSNDFLRPGIPHMDRRLQYARDIAGDPTGSAMPPQAPQQQNALAQFFNQRRQNKQHEFNPSINALTGIGPVVGHQQDVTPFLVHRPQGGAQGFAQNYLTGFGYGA